MGESITIERARSRVVSGCATASGMFLAVGAGMAFEGSPLLGATFFVCGNIWLAAAVIIAALSD